MARVKINTVVRMVDNWRKRYPGTVNNKSLLKIGIQKERRLYKRLLGRKVKNVIYLLEGTKQIWYKRKEDAIGVVAMGFSTKHLAMHPSAVPMEFYYEVFTSPKKMIQLEHLTVKQQATMRDLAMTGSEWLALNDYEINV